MRRYFAWALLVAIVAQPLGALATTPHVTGSGMTTAPWGTGSVVRPIALPLARHTPLPRRPMADYGSHARYARLIPKARGREFLPPKINPIDLIKLGLEHPKAERFAIHYQHAPRRVLTRSRSQGASNASATPPPSVTGVVPWWTYETRSIPGVGKAMANVTNLNFLLSENDVEIPEGELDLSFSRVYNSESRHDYNNDDGSGSAVFGNRWTNNLDVHLAWTSTGTNTGIVSVYGADGARQDFNCTINVVGACATTTAGVYDLLGTLDVSGNVACEFQWTKKDGVSYMFYAPYAACGTGQGLWGRLYAIDGRNINYSLQLAYIFDTNGNSSIENLSQITVTHTPDNEQLVLAFGQIANTSITELASITLPNTQATETINYHYDSIGELVDVDKPGNNPILPSSETLPTKFLDGNSIATGNLPETYDVKTLVGGGGASSLMEVCGPRAAIAIINNPPPNGQPSDGGCADFDYSNQQLTDWYTRGVLNPTPGDNVSPSPIQTGVSTSFVQWDDTQFFNNQGTSCNPLSEASMQDAYGHNIAWCYDSAGRVQETTVATSSSGSLTTGQQWDGNNDLIAVTDARNNATNIAYDPNGNVIEIALPQQATNDGTLIPTWLFDYDGYNNVLNVCDPTNNANNGWKQSQSDSLCANSGSTYYTKLQYGNNDSNEPYGCLKYVSRPSGYETKVTYPAGGPCGSGLPYQMLGNGGTAIQQPVDGSSRTPTLTFNYNDNGTVHSYADGNSTGLWVITYTGDNMNRVYSIDDPDGVTSYGCHNQDGSVFYSETAQQNKLDSNGNPASCPSIAKLESGATPPPYATSYGYDADGDPATILNHNNCTASACAADNNAATKCYNAVVAAGTTCNFYDGLDRLVEVKLPYDKSVDLYQSPWITRYLYDLTGSNSAYGNLFETQELVPSPANMSTPSPLATGQIGNESYQVIKTITYDGADRPVTKSSSNGSTPYVETLTWDTSPLDSNVAGLLGQDCNSPSTQQWTQQCQEFDYLPDGELETFNSNDGSSPKRTYQYDPDGRVTQITQQGRTPQSYGYDADGNVLTSTDASSDVGSQATLTHHRYVDGLEKSLDVASTPSLNQTSLFTYSYFNDGHLRTDAVNDSSVSQDPHAGTTKITYGYTNAGRLQTRQESGSGNSGQTTISYYTSPSTGLISELATPVGDLTNYKYSAESEVMSVTAPTPPPGSCSGGSYSYSLRGELTNQPNCAYSQLSTFMANGLSFKTPASPVQQETYGWNDLLTSLNNAYTCWKGSCTGASWSYDNAGRMNSETASYPQTGTSYPTTAQRSYDAENHIIETVLGTSQGNLYPDTAYGSWGPDGHPIVIGTATNNQSEVKERLHWNGDQLLFTTNNSGALDDIKIDTQGDILPQDSGYKGLTFYDRGPGGLVIGCHNTNGTSYAGLGDTSMNINLAPCSWGSGMPNSTVWYGSPYDITNPTGGNFIGGTGTIGLPRPDGIADGFDTLQGVRAYDSLSGQWTTPDAYIGSPDSPASQASYTWNGNNPVANSDPSGYFTDKVPASSQTPTPDTGPPDMQTPQVCLDAAIDCSDVANDTGPDHLRVIATVAVRKNQLHENNSYWCDEDAAPMHPPAGLNWASEYLAGALNGFSVSGAIADLTGYGFYNYQAHLDPATWRPASNFGVGVYAKGARWGEQIMDLAIDYYGEKDKLNLFEIAQDKVWAHEGYLFTEAYCHP